MVSVSRVVNDGKHMERRGVGIVPLNSRAGFGLNRAKLWVWR